MPLAAVEKLADEQLVQLARERDEAAVRTITQRYNRRLFRVARNRITDLFRKKQPERFDEATVAGDEGERLELQDLLPSPDAGPDALYARGVLLDELELAIDELPDEQREVFVAHEIEGRSFKEMAAETGVSINTLLSRKRYAVLRLRERLQIIYDEIVKA